MPDFERTATIESPPQRLFDYLADMRHLPEYLPPPAEVEQVGEGEVTVESEGRHEHGWFRVDSPRRRIEWGSAETEGYHGWMMVDDAGDRSMLTVHLHHDAPAGERDLSQAIDKIKSHVESA